MVTWTPNNITTYAKKQKPISGGGGPDSTALAVSDLPPSGKAAKAGGKQPPPVSTDEARLNKTERAFLAYLRTIGYTVGVQDITLKLAHDCRYTPDFNVWQAVAIDCPRQLYCYEVKGFMRDDAKVKLAVAARHYPHIKFVLVRKGRDRGWEMEDAKP